jgi:hypothetical protein
MPAHQPAGPPGLPLSSLADVCAPTLSSSLGQAGRALPSSEPGRAMVRSRPAVPSPLTLPLLATSASPSSGNRRRTPSMAPPSRHRRPVASIPLGTYKMHPGRASSHRTPHRPLFLLSRAGAHPHHAPSSSPVRAPRALPCLPLPPPPLVATTGEP